MMIAIIIILNSMLGEKVILYFKIQQIQNKFTKKF